MERTHIPCVRQNNNPTKQLMTGIVGTHSPCVQLDDSVNNVGFPRRKSPRAEFHDYSGGNYFVTICTRDKEHYFGDIFNGEMHLSSIGKYCAQQFENVTAHYPYAEIPLYVVMPNHIHAIICIENRTHEPCVPTVRTALSVVVGGLKRTVTMFARRNCFEFGWQSRYHDHIIRGKRDGNMISEYIENNIACWTDDCFYR